MKKDFNRIGATLCSSMRPRSSTTSWLNKFKLLALVLTTMLSVNLWGADTWTKLTSVPAVGDVVIFVNESAKREMTGISSYGIATTYSTSPAGTYPLTVCAGSSNGKLAFKTSDNKYLYWNSGNSLGVNETLDNKTSWTVSVSSGDFTIINVYGSTRKLQYNKASGSERFACYTSSQQLIQIYKKAATKTLSSISVKTAPTKTTYTEGDNFDPTGLVITKTYSDATPEDWAYASHASDFTFSPTTSTALTTSNTSVTITVGGKSTNQAITVNAKVSATITLMEAGTAVDGPSDKYSGDSYTLPSSVSHDCGTKTFVGWSTVEIQNPGAKPISNFYEPGAEVTLAADNTFYAVFADASNGGGSTTKSYGFEDSDDETLWIVDGPAKESGNAHSGSKSGKINTNNTYVQFKNKVKVTSFSYWFKRASTNNNYNVYIETSTDGTNWETVDTKAMSSFNNGSYAVSPVEKTFDGTEELYVRFHCYSTTAIRYVDDVSITYSGGTTYSNYTTSCISTYTLLFSELKIALFYRIFKSFFLAYVKQPLSMV